MRVLHLKRGLIMSDRKSIDCRDYPSGEWLHAAVEGHRKKKYSRQAVNHAITNTAIPTIQNFARRFAGC